MIEGLGPALEGLLGSVVIAFAASDWQAKARERWRVQIRATTEELQAQLRGQDKALSGARQLALMAHSRSSLFRRYRSLSEAYSRSDARESVGIFARHLEEFESRAMGMASPWAVVGLWMMCVVVAAAAGGTATRNEAVGFARITGAGVCGLAAWVMAEAHRHRPERLRAQRSEWQALAQQDYDTASRVVEMCHGVAKRERHIAWAAAWLALGSGLGLVVMSVASARATAPRCGADMGESVLAFSALSVAAINVAILMERFVAMGRLKAVAEHIRRTCER